MALENEVPEAQTYAERERERYEANPEAFEPETDYWPTGHYAREAEARGISEAELREHMEAIGGEEGGGFVPQAGDLVPVKGDREREAG